MSYCYYARRPCDCENAATHCTATPAEMRAKIDAMRATHAAELKHAGGYQPIERGGKIEPPPRKP